MKRLVIIGTSETAERILVFCNIYKLYDVIGFAIDAKYKKIDTFHGLPVWELETLDKHIDKQKDFLYVALFWNHLNGDRRRLYERLKRQGYHFANIISPKASVRGDIGENCWIMDYTIVQEGAEVGDNVIIADMALVGNLDCIGAHCFIGAQSMIMGGVKIGEQTFVGNGSTVFENLEIGSKCIIGATTVVKEDIPSCTVVKNPMHAQILKHYSDIEIESKMVANYHQIKQLK